VFDPQKPHICELGLTSIKRTHFFEDLIFFFGGGFGRVLFAYDQLLLVLGFIVEMRLLLRLGGFIRGRFYFRGLEDILRFSFS